MYAAKNVDRRSAALVHERIAASVAARSAPAASSNAAGADLAATEAAMRSCTSAADRLSTFCAAYTRLDEYRSFQMWLDAWAEARRRPALGATSRRLNVAWQRLISTTITEGIDEGAMSCVEPDATAWRVLSLLDGLSMQLAAHPGVIERPVALDWAMTALEAEVRIPEGSLTRPTATPRSKSRFAT